MCLSSRVIVVASSLELLFMIALSLRVRPTDLRDDPHSTYTGVEGELPGLRSRCCFLPPCTSAIVVSSGGILEIERSGSSAFPMKRPAEDCGFRRPILKTSRLVVGMWVAAWSFSKAMRTRFGPCYRASSAHFYLMLAMYDLTHRKLSFS